MATLSILHALKLSLQKRDAEEGADIIMVKPALPYLDIIADAAQIAPDHPLACYQVSGEFAMVHAGAAAGVYNLKTMAFETVESMIRAGSFYHLLLLDLNDQLSFFSAAGASLILTYFTPDFLEWLDEE